MIRFHCSRRDDEVILRVSPRALDRAHAATDPHCYLSVDDRRATRLMQWSPDEPITAPEIGVYDVS